MNPLQQLIKARMAKLRRSYRGVEDASRDPATGTPRISKARVQQLAEKPLTRVPKVALVQGLAAGLDCEFGEVWDAAAAAAGETGLQQLYRRYSDGAEVMAASYDELSPEQQRILDAIVETLRNKQ